MTLKSLLRTVKSPVVSRRRHERALTELEIRLARVTIKSLERRRTIETLRERIMQGGPGPDTDPHADSWHRWD